MRFHLTGLPGQPVTKENSVCAFTQKVRKFAEMMVPRGHEVYIYGDPEHSVNCTEYIECYPSMENPPLFEPKDWEPHNLRAAAAISERSESDDFLGLMGGLCQKSLVDTLPQLMPVEYGIGYGGAFAEYKVFESYAWMHTFYGQTRGTNSADGSFFDAVIPAYFEVDDFSVEEHKEDYLLFTGRMTSRKGVEIAEETARMLNMPIKYAGAGEYEPQYGEVLGNLGPKERNEAMAKAQAFLCPTIYIEPFGCVAVEAMLCGTPAIATDWGAFTETIKHGVSGYRARTLGEFAWAAGEGAKKLDPFEIRDYAVENYSLEAIAPKYESYFEQLQLLRGEGWYSPWSGITKTHRYGHVK